MGMVQLCYSLCSQEKVRSPSPSASHESLSPGSPAPPRPLSCLTPRPVSRSQTLGTSWLMLYCSPQTWAAGNGSFQKIFPIPAIHLQWRMLILLDIWFSSQDPTPTHGVRLVKDSRYPSPARPSQNAPGRPQSARAWSEALHPSSWPSEWTASVFSHAGL